MQPVSNRVGIMQGRLSPPGPRAQAFPWNTWEEEFGLAQSLQFDAIEWLFDSLDFERNPLWTTAGIERIQARIAASGVSVTSVCANYFMAHPFFRVAEDEAQASSRVLVSLVERAQAIGAGRILLPVLEQAEIRTPAEQSQLLEMLHYPLQAAQARGLVLALETELPAPDLFHLVRQANHPALGVYYDVGNATAKGYTAEQDLRILARYLSGVHIKDRARHGPNVLLGTGGVNFERVFSALDEIGYRDSLVLETTVGGDYYHNAQRHLEFVRTQVIQAQARAGRAPAPTAAP